MERTSIISFTFVMMISLQVFLLSGMPGSAPLPEANNSSDSLSLQDYNRDPITYADVIERFSRLGESEAHEKLYITTDKPYYKTGEAIWFSGFLVDAMTHRAVTDTRYIYVELVNSADRVVAKAKVVADSSHRFHNCLELHNDIAPGDYCLVGYTQWMKNHGEEFFFTQKISIANTQSGNVVTNSSFSHLGPHDKIMHVTFTNRMNEPYVQERLLCRLMSAGEEVRSFYVKTDDQGTVDIELNNPTDTLLTNAIFISTGLESSQIFSAFITMPTLSDDFSVGFYPEGGYLIPGAYQNIAFKGIGADGLSFEFSGKLYDGDELVAEFSPIHQGMGVLRLMADKDSRLRAEITSNKGIVKNFDILVDSSGMALSVVRRGDKYVGHIDYTPDMAQVPLILVAHSRGKLVMAHSLEGHKSDFSIPAYPFFPGIAEIAIADPRSGDILSRRLIFHPDENRVEASVTTDTASYGRRRPVRATVELCNVDKTPVRGDLALSVTDFRIVLRDGQGEDINTYLLLSSDLRGYIENPGSYFTEEAGREGFADLLMLTQGWTRFDISSVIKGNISTPEYEKERSISLSGRVAGVYKKAKGSILYVNQNRNASSRVNLNTDGRFSISDLEVTSNENIILQAIRRSGKGLGLDLEMDDVETFIGVPYSIPRPRMVEGPAPGSIPERYVMSSQPLVRYRMENGMRVIDFESVVVKPKSGIIENSYVPAEIWGPKEIGKISDRLFIDVYSRISGDTATVRKLKLMTGRINKYNIENTRIYNPEGLEDRPLSFVDTAIIYYDGIRTSLESVQFLRVSDLASIEVLGGPQARVIEPRANKIIILRSKSGSGILPSHTTLSLSKLSGIGPKPPVAFYQPLYHVEEELKNYGRDLRSTIAWEPALTTGPDGKCEISFYTTDKRAPFELRIEGVSEDGRTFTAQATIMTGVE